MSIEGFLAGAMKLGYDYDDAWLLLDKAIANGQFDRVDVTGDEASFTDAMNELATGLKIEKVLEDDV